MIGDKEQITNNIRRQKVIFSWNENNNICTIFDALFTLVGINSFVLLLNIVSQREC